MADAVSRLKLLLEAKDAGATSTLKNIKVAVDDVGASRGALSGIGDAINQLIPSFGSLASAAIATGAAFGALQVGQQVFELGALGAQTQRTAQSFDYMANSVGANAQEMLTAMRAAAQGTIADSELMQSANRAMVLGVATNTEQMTQLLEVAAARAKVMGLSTAQAFSDLVTGIGRMSPLILDNLGIMTGGEKLFEQYARTVGRTAESLTDMERKQILVNKVVGESAGLVASLGSSSADPAANFERMNAALQNSKEALGVMFAPAVAVIAEQIANAAITATNAMKAGADNGQWVQSIGLLRTNIEGLDASIQRSRAQLSEMAAAGKTETAAYATATDNLNAKIVQRNTLQGQLAAMIRQTAPLEAQLALNAYQVADATNAASVAMAGQSAQAHNLGGSIAILAGQYDLLIQRQSILSGMSASIGGIASQIVGKEGAGGALKFYNDSNVALETQVKHWQETGYSQEEISNVLMPAYVSNLRTATQQTYEIGKYAPKIPKAMSAAAAATKEVNQEFENLKGKLSGVLSGALGDDLGGIDLKSMLPRQDSVAEDARRLADVAVNGFASPWASYFEQNFPQLFSELTASGDVKTAAATILRDFQDGLRPELLDKNRAKELVKRALIGEKNTKAMIDEIAKELATELGISMEKVRETATAALGGGGGIVEAATSGSSGALSIKPTIDTSTLIATPIELRAKVTDITVTGAALKEFSVDNVVANVSTVRLLASATLPSVVIGIGATINDVNVRSDIVKPDVDGLTGYVNTVRVLASTELPDLSLPAGAYVRDVELASGLTPLALPASVTISPSSFVFTADDADAVKKRINEQIKPTITLGEGTFILPSDIAESARAGLSLALRPTITPIIDSTSEALYSEATFAGNNIGVGIYRGIEAANLPGSIAFLLSSMSKEAYSSGSLVGTSWGGGFLDTVGSNIPPALIDILASLVAPRVTAQQAKDASKRTAN